MIRVSWGRQGQRYLLSLVDFPRPHRIVAKVDEPMAVSDRLVASLTAATRRRLLDALLAEALESAKVRELEAAE